MQGSTYLGTEKGSRLLGRFAIPCIFSLILFTCVQKVCAIFLQSIGHAKAAAPLSVLCDVLLIVFSLVIPIFTGVTGIFWAAPVADVIAIIITSTVMVRLWKELSIPDSGIQEAVWTLHKSRPGVIVTVAREHGSAGKPAGSGKPGCSLLL